MDTVLYIRLRKCFMKKIYDNLLTTQHHKSSQLSMTLLADKNVFKTACDYHSVKGRYPHTFGISSAEFRYRMVINFKLET